MSRSIGIAVALVLNACSGGQEEWLHDSRMFDLQSAMSGELIERLPSGLEIRATYTHAGRNFSFVRKIVEFGDPFAEELSDSPNYEDPPLTVDDFTDDELAEGLRPLILVHGEYEYLGAAPEYELALKIRAQHELIKAGLEREAAQLAPWISPSADLDKDEVIESTSEGLIPKSIIGMDDREVANNTTVAGKSQIIMDNTNTGSLINSARHSATLIGISTAVSAAHGFWDEQNGVWEPWYRWAPGYDGADTDPSPYGEWFECYNAWMPLDYTLAPDNSSTQRFWDFVVLEFSQGPNGGCNQVDPGGTSSNNSDTPSVGSFGAAVRSEAALEGSTITVRGYPGQANCGNPAVACGNRQWQHNDTTPQVSGTDVFYSADTTSGQSGSGGFQSISNPPAPCVTSGGVNGNCFANGFVVAIHRSGVAPPSFPENSGRRYDSTVHNWVLAYSAEY